MLERIEYAALGFETFHDDILAPCVVREVVELDVEVFQCEDHLKPNQVRERTFTPVQTGWRWGPVWSTAWFRLRGRVPQSMQNDSAILHFSAGTEALLWLDGIPRQGFDPYHHHARLDLAGTATADILIEAACNRPLGASLFWWEHAEEHGRWKEHAPGRLEQAALELHDPKAEEFCRAWMFAVRMMRTADESSGQANRLERGLRELKTEILGSDLAEGTDEHLKSLLELLESGFKSDSRCVTIGHAHIDTAWLWPISETKRKCLRTFATQLRNMEEWKDFRFLCSQPQQYAYVEEESPELFEEIRARVKEGRWEPFGAMWIEPDANIPSGESLIRQIVHGSEYFKRKFGAKAGQDALYLPDTFGFPASLPQICRQAGLETFITNKIAWCETNRFPHVTFEWKGIDGSSVLTHFTPGHNYNSSIMPQDFIDAEKRMLRSDGARCETWLQPYGWGDGGGGPDREQMSNARLAGLSAGMPEILHSSAREFCTILHDEYNAGGRDAVWDGELYLELHRGTYTTHARLKASNRQAENELREIEALEFLNRASPSPESPRSSWLDEAWKTVLLNQFHDILPGSSIESVYTKAHEDLDRLHGSCRDILEEQLRTLAGTLDTRRVGQPILVWNPASSEVDAVVDTDGGTAFVSKIPPLGIKIIDMEDPETPKNAVQTSGQRLENGLTGFEIDATGRVCELHSRGVLIPVERPLNTLVLHSDRPRRWQAWDLDRDYTDHREEQVGPADQVAVVESSDHRGVIEIRRSLGEKSHISQRYVLEANSPVIRIETHLDWQEEHRILRAEFIPEIRSRFATHGIQFGCIQRPTHANTSWEQAAFEIPGHLWMDLAQPGRGLAILDDGSRLGRSCKASRMGLSLVRATEFPDPKADRGVHTFAYGIMPHLGDWRTEGVFEQAERFGRKPRIMTAHAQTAGSRQDGWSTLPQFNETDGIEISACKRAENGNGWVVRLVEIKGAAKKVRLPIPEGMTHVEEVDLLEANRPDSGLVPENGAFSFTMNPFQIRTLRFH